MIEIKHLTLQRGPKMLLRRASATILPRQRVGLVGKNGTGKSSLFALLKGSLQPDQGEILVPAHWIVATVAQETPAVETAALEYVLDGDPELREVEALISRAESTGNAEHIAAGHERLLAMDGYAARARAAELLAGLGFRMDQMQQPVVQFSGGWRMRLNLAQALMRRSDLLLLDEPTNHLDLEAVIWLENWLARYRGTLLLISHDRDVLDHTVEAILHIDQEQLRCYTGNYAAFEEQRAQQMRQQQASFEQQQRLAAHLRSYIDRFSAKATKARQAQSRIKALERMEQVAAVRLETLLTFHFAEPTHQPYQLLALENVSAGYGVQPVLQGLTLEVVAGMRVGLLGSNGAGKSTLMKLLAGEVEALSGERRLGRGVSIGYFAQQQLEQLDAEASPLLHLQRIDPQAREQALRDFLGGFLFSAEAATASIAHFSGGEKTRLALSLLIWKRPNILLLDEPTNHLDLPTRDALIFALQRYTGALVVVSHDRYLLTTTSDVFWRVEGGRVEPFEGDLDDYQAEVRQRTTFSKAAVAPTKKSPLPRQPQRVKQNSGYTLKKLEKEQQKIDQQLSQISQRLEGVEKTLADSGRYSATQVDERKRQQQTQSQLFAEQAGLEARWLEIQSAIDAQQSGSIGSQR